MMQDVTSVSSPDASTTLISDVTASTWERRATIHNISAKGRRFFRKCVKRGNLFLAVIVLFNSIVVRLWFPDCSLLEPCNIGFIRIVTQWRGGEVARWRGGAVARWRGDAMAQWRRRRRKRWVLVYGPLSGFNCRVGAWILHRESEMVFDWTRLRFEQSGWLDTALYKNLSLRFILSISYTVYSLNVSIAQHVHNNTLNR